MSPDKQPDIVNGKRFSESRVRWVPTRECACSKQDLYKESGIHLAAFLFERMRQTTGSEKDTTMNSTPTLQALAVEARDAFGEDGTPRTNTGPASFDVVVEVYAREGRRATGERVDSHACTALTRSLDGRREATIDLRQAVQAYVSRVLQFLRAQYPDSDAVKQDQGLLSTLFWGHLIEARHARPSPG